MFQQSTFYYAFENKNNSIQYCKKIAFGLDNLNVENIKNEKLPYDVEDLVFLIEKHLGEIIGKEIVGHLHIPRSKNEIDATISRIISRTKFLEFMKELLRITETIIQKSEQNLTNLLLYTYGQRA